MNWTLEVVTLPVTDVDRTKEFYESIGFNPDEDHTVSEEIRFVQMTPPGSNCSIAFGKGLTDKRPGPPARSSSASPTSTPPANSCSPPASTPVTSTCNRGGVISCTSPTPTGISGRRSTCRIATTERSTTEGRGYGGICDPPSTTISTRFSATAAMTTPGGTSCPETANSSGRTRRPSGSLWPPSTEPSTPRATPTTSSPCSRSRNCPLTH